MPRQPLRTLTLFDAATLIAATAVALAIARTAHPGIRSLYGNSIWEWIQMSVPFGILWMLSILGLRFLPPRPSLRHLARRPGMVACCVVAVYTLWNIAWTGLWAAKGGFAANHNFWSDLLPGLGHQVGGVLPAAWVTLAFSGRWRSEPSWFDRAGRLLGAYFIVMFWLVPLLAALL